ncbi:MAG TPA: hypothetical protein VGM26_16660 [Rhizomicrobium sp.]
MNRILAVVLRFSGVKLPQSLLEVRLGCAVDRFGDGYAQVDVVLGKDEEWGGINACLMKRGGSIRQMIEENLVASVQLDVAYGVAEDLVGISRTIPARTAALAGSEGIDVTMTLYRSGES